MKRNEGPGNSEPTLRQREDTEAALSGESGAAKNTHAASLSPKTSIEAAATCICAHAAEVSSNLIMGAASGKTWMIQNRGSRCVEFASRDREHSWEFSRGIRSRLLVSSKQQ